MTLLWICGLPEEVRKAHPVTDVPSAAWSWIVGHLPPPKDVELHIICPVFGMKEAEAHFEYGGVRWHCFRLKRLEPLFLRLRFFYGIRRFVRNLKPDVVHGWGGESGCGLLATYCSPYAVVSVQGLLRMLCANAKRWKIKIPECGSISSWLRRMLEGWTYRRAHRLLVESETAAESLRTLYGCEREVVPYPLRGEFVNHEIHERHEKGNVFLFVGQMTTRKGAMDALRAFAAMDNKDAILTMVGFGDLDTEIDSYIQKHGLTNRVKRTGGCSANELLKLIDEANAILVPTYGDTGPTILKEAMSQGIYPICYDNTGAAELVGRYSFGEVCSTGDWKAFGKAMDRFCKTPVRRKIKVAERVRSDLSRASAWRSLRRVYASVHFEEPPQRGGAVWQRVGHFAKMLEKGSPAVISFHTGIRQNICAAWKARKAGLRVVREINEWPLSVTWKERWFKRWFEVNVLPKLFDGAICISDVLVEFWRKHGRKGVPILKLPMTVDVEAIDNIPPSQCGNSPYICYAGGMTEEKDGVETLKKAYEFVKRQYPQVELKLLHDLPHDEAVSVMKGAACLALARPDSLQAQAGFPTKLGEYLATGRPVVVTRTGEIDRFLVNGESAYLAEPGNVDDIARQISSVFADTDKAARIGYAGRNVALMVFDWRVHQKELTEWLRRFI